MGSDESHFNVSLTVRDKVTRQCPQTTIFEETGEPKRYRTEVLPLASLPPLPLGHTGSLLEGVVDRFYIALLSRPRTESLRSCLK